MNIIEAHINYEINNKQLFDNINITIKKGSFVSIIGENGVGKTTLLKLLSGLIITNNNIKIDNIQVNKYNMEEVNRKVSYITSYNEFFSKTVLEEILGDIKLNNQIEVNRSKKLLDEFNLLYLEKMSPLDLSYAENQIVALIKAIVKRSKIIVLDNAFLRLDIDKRNELFSYIKKYAKDNGITILMTSTDSIDLLYSDRILLIRNNSIMFDGNYEALISNINLGREGFKYPFEIEVSNKLIMYDLIRNVHSDIDSIVGELCK